MYSMHPLLISVQISIVQWINITAEMIVSFLRREVRNFGDPLGRVQLKHDGTR